MKDCGIVKDLLPLVAENMASEESTAFVEKHLETCADCKKAFEEMKAPVRTEPAAPLKTVKRTVKRRGWLIAGLIACLVAALLVGVFARLTKPIVIHSADEAFIDMQIKPEVSGNDPDAQVLYLTRSEWVRVDIERSFSHQGASGEQSEPDADSCEVSVRAYTTLWDQMLTKHDTWAGLGILLTDDVDAVFFEPYNNTDREALYVREGYTPDAAFALPRLVMNYYFAIALVATVILFVPWLVLLLTKKQKARRIFGILLLIPLCGMLAFLFAGFPATTIEPIRDTVFVLVIAALLFGAGLCGRALFEKN